MSKPLVSILIPSYNSERFIARAIESALVQTYGNVEVIVVDNASTDGTYAVAEQYISKDRRLKVYRNSENIGPVRNWQRCAELAQGEYAGLLFSDDWYESTFIEKAIEYLQNPEVGFVFSKVHLVNVRRTGQEPAGLLYDLPYEGKLPSQIFLEGHLYLQPHQIALPVSPGCSLCRLADLRTNLAINIPDLYQVGYMDHGAGLDVLINLLNSIKYPYFAYIGDPLVNFGAHDANLNLHPKASIAYILAKAYFVEEYASSFIDYRKFCTALFWWLWRAKYLHLYHSLTKGRERRYKIDWLRMGFYVVKQVGGKLKAVRNSKRK